MNQDPVFRRDRHGCAKGVRYEMRLGVKVGVNHLFHLADLPASEAQRRSAVNP
jgi:hypothetical protein